MTDQFGVRLIAHDPHGVIMLGDQRGNEADTRADLNDHFARLDNAVDLAGFGIFVLAGPDVLDHLVRDDLGVEFETYTKMIYNHAHKISFVFQPGPA